MATSQKTHTARIPRAYAPNESVGKARLAKRKVGRHGCAMSCSFLAVTAARLRDVSLADSSLPVCHLRPALRYATPQKEK
jgi:hypothetical protein